MFQDLCALGYLYLICHYRCRNLILSESMLTSCIAQTEIFTDVGQQEKRAQTWLKIAKLRSEIYYTVARGDGVANLVRTLSRSLLLNFYTLMQTQHKFSSYKNHFHVTWQKL